jgi:SAM-dependent methyltransferase
MRVMESGDGRKAVDMARSRRRTTAVLAAVRHVVGGRQLGQLVRAEPVLRLVRELGGGELLDVGSGGLGLADMLDDRWRVTALDTVFDDYGAWRRGRAPQTRATRIVGDVRRLPFPDDSFDVVVALDLLEHLAPADRPVALAELGRVARRRVIAAAPAGAAALQADRELAASLRSAPPWLHEHLTNGFPYPEDIIVPLRAVGVVREIPNESIDAHLRLTRRELSVAWYLPTRLAARVVAAGLRDDKPWASAFLRRIRGGDRRPVYRSIVVAEIPEIAASTSASSSAASAS